MDQLTFGMIKDALDDMETAFNYKTYHDLEGRGSMKQNEKEYFAAQEKILPFIQYAIDSAVIHEREACADRAIKAIEQDSGIYDRDGDPWGFLRSAIMEADK